jgi:hypothetical protein
VSTTARSTAWLRSALLPQVTHLLQDDPRLHYDVREPFVNRSPRGFYPSTGFQDFAPQSVDFGPHLLHSGQDRLPDTHEPVLDVFELLVHPIPPLFADGGKCHRVLAVRLGRVSNWLPGA